MHEKLGKVGLVRAFKEIYLFNIFLVTFICPYMVTRAQISQDFVHDSSVHSSSKLLRQITSIKPRIITNSFTYSAIHDWNTMLDNRKGIKSKNKFEESTKKSHLVDAKS